MTGLIEDIRQGGLKDCFSDTELFSLVEGSEHRRYALVKRSLAKGDLIQVRRGLYCLSEKSRTGGFNLFSVAQKIYGPSYISLESALSHHGWIPEAVFSVTSASIKRSREFHTPLGAFGYVRVPSDPFFTAVALVEDERGNFFLASPWKALADYVYVHKKDWKGLRPLMESLRIEEERLKAADLSELEEIRESFRNRRVKKFLRSVIQELR